MWQGLAVVQAPPVGVVPWPEDVAARYVANGYWEGHALGTHLREVARKRPDAVALVDGDTRMSYAELLDAADGLASRMGALGLRRDDRIVVQLPNRWEFAVLILACLRLGVIPVMALPAHREHEMTYLAEHAEAKATVVPDALKDFDHQGMAREIADRLDCVDHVLVVGDHVQDGGLDLGALCVPADDPPAARRGLDADPPYVVPEPGATVELSDVHDVMRQAGVARFKHPERLVTVDSLSMTKIGKIDKKALREDIAQRMDEENSARIATP